MTVLTVTINDPVFDKKSAEVGYLARALRLAADELHRAQGTRTSGTILGTDWLGRTNQALGSWTYTASAATP